VYQPEELPCPLKIKLEEEVWNKKPKKLTRNLGAIKMNIYIVKELLEPEGTEGEEVRINRKSSQLIGGNPQGKNERYKSIKFNLGEIYFDGVRDRSSNINIFPYQAYTLCCYYLGDHALEPLETTLVLLDRTYQNFHGILCNAYITVEDFVYLIDFYVIDILQDHFCPIILGENFFVLTKLNIDRKKEVMSLQLAEEEVSVKF
jgi:hypothetical protein